VFHFSVSFRLLWRADAQRTYTEPARSETLATLARDRVNVCDWFIRRGLECDAEEIFGDLVVDVF